MKKQLLFFLTLLVIENPTAQTIRFVNQSATGANTGASWANACVGLQAAIDAAAPGDQIWVAEGVYTPTAFFNGNSSDRYKTFFINKNIAIYGGFSGVETDLAARDFEKNITILSGDLGRDDLDPEGNGVVEDVLQVVGGNAYHIVWITDVDSSMRLDGFTLTAGCADGPLNEGSRHGGAVYNAGNGPGKHSNPTFSNCVFIANNSAFYGGVAYNNARDNGMTNPGFDHCSFRNNSGIFGGLYFDATFGGTTDPTIQWCSFSRNDVMHGGAALWFEANYKGAKAHPVVENCTFNDNYSGFGSILYTASTGFEQDVSEISSTFINCTFCSNRAGFGGVAHINTGLVAEGNFKFLNCLFTKNQASFGGILNYNSQGVTYLDYVNCTFAGNSANHGSLLSINIPSDKSALYPSFSNSLIWGNTPLDYFYLQNNSFPATPTFENTLLDQAGCPAGAECMGGMVYNQNPQFVNAGTGNLRLQPGSPAVDAGDNAVLPAGVDSDLDGHARVFNGVVDLGAFEFGETPPPDFMVTTGAVQPSCSGSATGSAAVTATGGTAPYTYSWSNGATGPLADQLAAGTYKVTVSDFLCAEIIKTIVITSLPPIVIQLTTTSGGCGGDGSVSAAVSGGTAPYLYAWSTGDQGAAIGNLTAGTFTLTVTDAQGCFKTATATILGTQAPTLTATATATTCSDNADGGASALASGGSGGYIYIWNTGWGGSTISGLAAGVYTVTVTDTEGCQGTSTVVVSSPPPIQIALLPEDVHCFGQANGGISASASGGTGALQFTWSTGASAPMISGLGTGAYTVTVTDAHDCAVTASGAVGEPPLLELFIVGSTPVSCTSGGAIEVAGMGGTGALTYSWNNGAQGVINANLPGGTYTATVTDASGCTAAVSEIIGGGTDTEPPQITAAPLEVALGAGGSVQLTMNLLAGLVTDNCQVAMVEFDPAGFDCGDIGLQMVTLTASDYAGNTATRTLEVTVVDRMAPLLVCPGNVTRCPSDNPVLYEAPVATDNCLSLGGQWALTEGLPSGSAFPEGQTTLVGYSYTDDAGNTGYCSFEVTITPAVEIKLDGAWPDSAGLALGRISVTITGGTPPFSFEWTKDGQVVSQEEDPEGLTAGSYTLEVTDAGGCIFFRENIPVSDLLTGREPAWMESLQVYPNPGTGLVTIRFPKPLPAPTDIQVFDLRGGLVLNLPESREKTILLDGTGLPDGVYVIRFGQKGESALRRWVIVR